MTLDAATAAFVSAALARRPGPTHDGTPDQARARGAGLTALIGPGPDMYAVRTQVVATADNPALVLRILLPEECVRGVIGYFHGGGWVLGALDEFDTLARTIAHRTGCAVVMVDYRLAPEHPYPAAVHDAAAAVSWLEVHVADVAGAAVPLVLLGDSAGGNLATGAALGNPRAAQALVLAYPVTDCDFETASYVDPENQLLMGVETMRWFFRHYAPDPDSWTRPDISVLRARDVSQLPPTLILLAEHDPLRDEGQAFADRMAAVGVPVDTRLFAGQMHGFLGLINLLPGAEAAVDAIVDHLQPVLAARPLSEAKADV